MKSLTKQFEILRKKTTKQTTTKKKKIDFLKTHKN